MKGVVCKLTCLCCVLFISLSGSSTAQQLPGPASEGWFVLMARVVFPGENKTSCAAIIVPGSEKNRNVLQPDKAQRLRASCTPSPGTSLPAQAQRTCDAHGTAWVDHDPSAAPITNRFGPFSNESDAQLELGRAGWSPKVDIVFGNQYGVVWSAASGC